jgi:anti-sigma factor RsiW
MSSLIQELENNEALLLMYLTGELPAEDRAEVDHMLANDAGLRAHLAGIESAYTGAMGALLKLDQDKSAEAGENHAIRQASRAMKQWQVDRLNRQPVVAEPARTKVPVWAYPIGVAAMLVIGSLIWWGGQADTVPASQTKLAAGPSVPAMSYPAANVVAALSPEEIKKANLIETSIKGEIPSDISDAETQANSLIARSDSETVASSIYLKDGNP